MSRQTLLHTIQLVGTLIALLGVGFHVQVDHAGDVEVELDQPDVKATIPETQPGRAATPLQPSPALIERLTQEEGFRGMPYNDSLGHATIGIGTKLPLTRGEAQWLLKERLTACLQALASLRPAVEGLPMQARDVIGDLCYSHGPLGIAQYHRMWVALEARQWHQAASELLDSKWAREEAPRRAQRLAAQLGQM